MPQKILLIENDNIFRWRLLHFLEEHDYQILEAADGAVGLELARIHQPNLVLSEINLPCLNGYDVFKQFQKYKATASIPFIFLTNRDESEHMSALKVGATDCLSKALPFTKVLERLLPHLKNVCLIDSSIK